MENDKSDSSFGHNKVIFQIIILVSAAFIVSSVYHLIAICLCHRRRTTTDQNQLQPPNQAAMPSLAERTSSSVPVVHRIPTHKYHKRDKVDAVSDDEGGTCAVCLGDFEEGEELRTMPECLHSYHVDCIDMWLHSHSSCPICRAGAAPSQAVRSNHHSIDMNMAPLGTVMQSGLARW
ncbi:RING-H2 finger protein ATL51-like [Vicia villosa]|uniref:RING-H2 finger protein ATL51-like n=1 Tax=Vicia villosa TaxID=3911 RepID=UPI00273C0843|nr:RING-H2 finger protein ATL51-like [Vicia villosa]